MEAIAFRVPTEVRAALRRIADQLDTTPSTIARLLLQSALRQSIDAGGITVSITADDSILTPTNALSSHSTT